MNVTIIGSGNIGTLIAAEFAAKGHDVVVYSRKHRLINEELEVYDAEGNFVTSGRIKMATDNLELAIKGADLIFICTPSETFSVLAHNLERAVEKTQTICVIPGTGGAEFAFSKIIKKGCCFMGFQRVHSIARLKEYGKSVFMLGRKDDVKFASIPANECEKFKVPFETTFDMPFINVGSYINVSLTPSNPILHTTRLYSMFSKQDVNYVYNCNPLFYEEWDNETSDLIIHCDRELEALCEALPFDMKYTKTLEEHYESFGVQAMTDKISHIPAFKNLYSPMIEKNSGNGWCVDWNSRYFVSDFSYGLKIIVDFCKVFGVKCETMERIWNWYLVNANPREYFSMPYVKEELVLFYK